MSKKYINHTLSQYMQVLSAKTPVPGGGSVCAYSASLAVGLILMVAQYSLGRHDSKRINNKLLSIIKKSEILKKRLMELVDLDAQAYLVYTRSAKGTKRERSAALNRASQVPKEVSKLCYKAVELTPELVEYCNKYLISDLEIALDLLLASYNSGMRLYHASKSN